MNIEQWVAEHTLVTMDLSRWCHVRAPFEKLYKEF